MISTVELTKFVAYACILGIIVGKLGYQKNFYLIVLFKVNKGLKIGMYYAVLPFRLPISL